MRIERIRILFRRAAAGLLLAAATFGVALPSAMAKEAAMVSDLSVYWVGHSLLEARVDTIDGPVDIIRLVGRFAAERGLGYRYGEHTLWGSPLSALWRGEPHAYRRDAAEMVDRRKAFEREAGGYDVLVATEGVPVSAALRYEYSAHYLRHFSCALLARNPNGRVLLYENWVGLHGVSGRPFASIEAWRAEMRAERLSWDELARTAAEGRVRVPGVLGRLGLATSPPACRLAGRIEIVPVGTVLLRTVERMTAPQSGDVFAYRDRPMQAADLFANAYFDGPDGRRLRDPAKQMDDIHPSEVGIYIAALTHFAVLYGQSPVGLSAPGFLSTATARTLQCIAWETVAAELRPPGAPVAAC